MNRIVFKNVRIISIPFIVVLLLAAAIIPLRAAQGYGTADYLSASVTKTTLQPIEASNKNNSDCSNPVGGTNVNVGVKIEHGSQVTITRVDFSFREKNTQTYSSYIQFEEDSSFRETIGEGQSSIINEYYYGHWNTLGLYNNKYLLHATIYYRKSGMTTYSYDSAEVESNVKNLIIDIDELAEEDHDVIYVPETGIPDSFPLILDDSVLSQTTITFKLYPTDRNANTEPICIPVSSEDIPFFYGFPFAANVTWLGLDNFENRVPSGTYVYTVSVSQPDGDNDSSESPTLKICDTFAGDSDDPDKMTMLYTMVDTAGHDATEAYVRVYDSLGVKVVDDTAGTKTCWSTEGAIDGWNYSELPIPEATEDAYGAFRCVVRAKDAGAATEKAHRNKWAIGKNRILAQYAQACYYTEAPGGEAAAQNAVAQSKKWMGSQGKWNNSLNPPRWSQDYWKSRKLGGTDTEGPYYNCSADLTIKSVIGSLGNVNSYNMFYYFGHGNSYHITSGGSQLTANELNDLKIIYNKTNPLQHINLAVLLSCNSLKETDGIGYKMKELGATYVVGTLVSAPYELAEKFSKFFFPLVTKGEWTDENLKEYKQANTWSYKSIPATAIDSEKKVFEYYWGRTPTSMTKLLGAVLYTYWITDENQMFDTLY